MAASGTSSPGRSDAMNYEGIRCAPENELGALLSSKIAKRRGFMEIEGTQLRFPDCLALRPRRPARDRW